MFNFIVSNLGFWILTPDPLNAPVRFMQATIFYEAILSIRFWMGAVLTSCIRAVEFLNGIHIELKRL